MKDEIKKDFQWWRSNHPDFFAQVKFGNTTIMGHVSSREEAHVIDMMGENKNVRQTVRCLKDEWGATGTPLPHAGEKITVNDVVYTIFSVREDSAGVFLLIEYANIGERN